MELQQTIENFINHWLQFSDNVHELKGVDEKLLQELLQDFKDLKEVLITENCIPKPIANILIDMVAALHTDALKYPENTQNQIYLAADKLAHAAYLLCE